MKNVLCKQESIIQMKVIIALWKKATSYCNNNSIEQAFIEFILWARRDHNAIKFPGRDSAFLASFCYKPAGEII